MARFLISLVAKPLKNDRFKIPKSRYSSTNLYLSTGPNYSGGSCSNDGFVEQWNDKYNDLDFPYDEGIYKHLMENGVDRILARHVATLFIRDPLVIYTEKLDQDDSKDSDHFEVRPTMPPFAGSFLFPRFRTFNRQIGRRCDSSRHHRITRALAGV